MSDAATDPARARPLAGRVCIVAGASRGVGRGIALALGEAGATVVCAARSSRFGARTEGRPETIEDVAEAVSEAGGEGLPYRCDCTDPKALHEFSAWVLRRLGPPHLLACSVWGGGEGFDGERHADGSPYGTPFFRRPLRGFEVALTTGPYALLATARAFVPLMLNAGAGLIVAIGFDAPEGAVEDGVDDLGWAGIRRAAGIVARDVQGLGLTAVHLSPGFVRTERVVAAGLADQATESPFYAGRAVAALAADPQVAAWHGRSLFVADLARHYGFTDADGSQPGRFELPLPS
jgi:NAD(P)-dependent dehydrogenase (short-subunit alcohol dehydrogenase family)